MNKKTINNCKRFLQENKPLYLELNLPIYGIIYKIENIITGSVYIGQTKRSFTERYNGGLKGWIKDKRIDDDISDFKVTEILDVAFCKYQIDLMEMYYINKYDSFYNGYNKKLNYPSYKYLLECCDILKGSGFRIKNIDLVNEEITNNIYDVVKKSNDYFNQFERNLPLFEHDEIHYYENILDKYFVVDYALMFTNDFGFYLRKYLSGKLGNKWGRIITEENIKDFIPDELYKEYKKPSSRKYLNNCLYTVDIRYEDVKRETLLSVNEKELIKIYFLLYKNLINVNTLGKYNPILSNCGFKNLLSSDKTTFSKVFRELEKRFRKYRINLRNLNLHFKLLLEVCECFLDNKNKDKDKDFKELFYRINEEIYDEYDFCLRHQDEIEVYNKFFEYEPLIIVNEDIYSIIESVDKNKYPLIHEFIKLRKVNDYSFK